MRTLSTILLGAALVPGAFAQFEIRPHAGMNMRDLTEAPALHEWRSQAGYQVGIDLTMGQQLYMAFGAQYVHSSTELLPVLGQDGFHGSLSTGALRVPVRLGFRFVHPSEEPLVNVRLFAGLAATFPMTTAFDQDGVEAPKLGVAQFAVMGGLGLDISILFIEAGYDMGLTTVFDENRWDVDPMANLLQVNAGIRLKLGR